MVSSGIVVFFTLLANSAIAVGKFLAWGLTGNASMLSQACHSVSDAGTQLLLLTGFRLGGSSTHAFRRRKAQYFFALVVSVLLFTISGYISFNAGYGQLGSPYREVNVTIDYVVLGLALVGQGLILAWSFRGAQRDISTGWLSTLWLGFHRTEDAPRIAAVIENTVAILGLMIALGGIYLTDITGDPFYDSVASLLIGVLLLLFAVILVWENRHLLVGGGVTSTHRQAIVETISGTEGVVELLDLRTMHLGPGEVLVAAEVAFDETLDAPGLEQVVEAAEAGVREAVPKITRIYIEPADGDIALPSG